MTDKLTSTKFLGLMQTFNQDPSFLNTKESNLLHSFSEEFKLLLRREFQGTRKSFLKQRLALVALLNEESIARYCKPSVSVEPEE